METDKLTVACELLEQSLRLYYEGNAYFSALHLAGAAEELLGAHLKAVGATSSFESWRTAGVDLANALSADGTPITKGDMEKLLTYAKNRTKHMDSLAEDGTAKFDPKEESKDLLDRAISDYYQLMNYFPLSETDLISRFNNDSHKRV